MLTGIENENAIRVFRDMISDTWPTNIGRILDDGDRALIEATCPEELDRAPVDPDTLERIDDRPDYFWEVQEERLDDVVNQGWVDRPDGTTHYFLRDYDSQRVLWGTHEEIEAALPWIERSEGEPYACRIYTG
jgi:hypothetical protein